jgi:short subunit dehydrogenase-like uncharacterized protein
MKKILLYGANGYTGQLIATHAQKINLPLILAGRSGPSIEALSQSMGLPYRIFNLDEDLSFKEQLKDIYLVVHAAGPFSRTAQPMIDACIELGIHYIDITGEIGVFKLAHDRHELALQKNIMILSGAGFDVVPTDCMAAFLHQKLPTAHFLQLAFGAINGGVSHGTAMTAIDQLGELGLIRKEGQLKSVPIGHKSMFVQFSDTFRRFVMAIPWGDVYTAYITTKIPNIETFMAIHPKSYRWLKRFQLLPQSWMKSSVLKKAMRAYIKKQPAGPSPAQNERGRTFVWGEVKDLKGHSCSASIEIPEAYYFTAISTVHIAQLVFQGEWKPGYQTPAGCYGHELLTAICGAHIQILDKPQ